MGPETLAMVAAASGVMSAGMAVVGGIGQANAAKSQAAFQRQQYEEKQQMLRLQAAQDESARRIQLDRTLQAQRALMAARGVSADESGSFLAIQDDSKANAEKDIFNAKLGYMTGIRQAQLGAFAADAEGQAGYTAGLMKAGSGFLSGSMSAIKAADNANWWSPK